MATTCINTPKSAKKCFFLIINGHGPFGQGVATLMLSSISSKNYKYFGRIMVESDIVSEFKKFSAL